MSDERRLRIAKAMGWTDIEPVEYWAEGYGWDAHVLSFKGRPPNGGDDREVPDFEHDIAAGIAALDALSVSTCFMWRLDNNKWIDGKRTYVCEIIDCDEMGITAYGATPAEAIAAALDAWFDKESVK